jgi:NAD(P)H dehydrogenase (quinone)
MSEQAKIAIIYYSSTGHAYQVAKAFEEGAKSAGAEVRLRRVQELAPQAAIAQNPQWKAHADATSSVPVATLDDLEWANGYVFGSPTRYGAVTAQLKQFIDQAGPLWMQGKLANKPVTVFTGAGNPHGGQENTILNIHSVMHHWGAVIVPPGYTDPVLYAAGGNPYGISYTASQGSTLVDEKVLAAARYQGARIARYASVIAANLGRLVPEKAAAQN